MPEFEDRINEQHESGKGAGARLPSRGRTVTGEHRLVRARRRRGAVRAARGGVWGVVLLGTALLLAYAVWSRVRSPFPSDTGPGHAAVGRPLTSLDLSPLTGDPPRIHSIDELRGKVVLINFWATDCPPCRQEFPALLRLHEQLADEPDFQFLSVSCGLRPVTLARLLVDTRSFLASQKTELPTYHDQTTGNRRALIDSAGLSAFGLPTTVVLDRHGVIRGLWLGYDHGLEEQMKQVIRTELARGG